MTGDPKRLLHATDATGPAGELERELLASASSADSPPHAQARVWGSLAGQLGIAAAAGSALAPGTAAAAAKAGGLASIAPKAAAGKLVFMLAAAGGVAAASAGYVAYQQQRAVVNVAAPAPPAPAIAPVAHVPAETSTTEPRAAEQAVPAPCTGPNGGEAPCSDSAAPSPSPARGKRAQPDQLAAESGLLAQARARLRQGDPPGAQALLDRLGARFPRGVLLQEREVLAIEVLAARGDRAGAKSRAQAFIRAHPESPHSQKLGRFLVDP